MTRVRRRLLVVICAGAACACGGSDGALLHRDMLVDVHEYGVSPCPQALGTIEVELGGGASGPLELALNEDVIAIDVLDPEIAWPIVDGWSITIQPGQVLVFPVEFNCGAVDDVEGSIELETARPGGGATVHTASVPITVDIQGAPF